MKKRFKFKCWNEQCQRTYSLFREITAEQTLTVACPYCQSEAVVDLQPYRKAKKDVLRGDGDPQGSLGDELQLPDVLPTRKPA